MRYRISHRGVRLLVGLLCTLVLLGLNLSGHSPQLMQRLEGDLYDQRLRATLLDEPDPRIVIIDIDESSMARVGRWPWPRDHIARLIEGLFEDYDAALVAFDILFSEPDDRIPLQHLTRLMDRKDGVLTPQQLQTLHPDQQLADTLAAYPVVLSQLFDPRDDRLHAGKLGPPLQLSAPIPPGVPLARPRGHVGNLPLLAEQAGAGFFDNPFVDPDGVYRRVPLLQQYQGHYYPALALAIWQALVMSPQVSPRIEYDASGRYPSLTALNAGGLEIPVDAQGAMRVPYRGGPGSFAYISAADILDGTAPHEQLAGTIVIVGTSAAGLNDLRVTPVSHLYPGVEVHANLVSAMLDARFLRESDFTRGIEALQLLLCGLLLSLTLPRVSVLTGTLLTLATSVGVIGFNLYAFGQLQWVVPLASVLWLIGLLYVLMQTTGYFLEARHRRKLALTFGQYVPPAVVSALERTGARAQLQGESRHMTVLFSDIRGFTTLSETLSSTQLTRMMNLYLSHMTEVIHQHQGTIDKYIGDAIMAFWGAPLADELHAQHALEAALAMQQAVHSVNLELAAEGLPAVTIGIGLNSGEMSVGNMGSSFRMAYTVMGDAVNLGARLEGLTKHYGVGILVSESIRSACNNHSFRELDRVRVKGKTQSVVLYEPLGPEVLLDAQQREASQRFAQALQFYRARLWSAAAAEFRAFLDAQPQDRTADLYLQRLEHLQTAPPTPDWDGVFTHTEK